MGRFAVISLLLVTIVCSSSIPPVNSLSNGLICYLPLDEGAGKLAFDKTKRTNDIGIPSISSSIEWNQSQKGKLLKWAGATVNDYVNIGKPSCLNLTSSNFTVSAWVRFTNASGVYRYIFSDYNAAGSNCLGTIYLNSLGKINFFWCNAGSQVPNANYGTGVTIASNTWYHIVGIRSGATGAWNALVYVNGIFQYTLSTATNPPTQANAGNARIGVVGDYSGASLCNDGNIKNVMLWNRALTEAEIKELYINQLSNL